VPYSVQVTEPFAARTAKHEGQYGTKAFKLYPTIRDALVSPWHDVSLVANANDVIASNIVFNMVVEIPMYSTAKMEMMKNELGNPIMQDTKDNKPRYYSYGIPFFNYGLLPQTWEDSTFTDPITGCQGDGDPIDAIEIGNGPIAMGSIVRVKVLGSLALIDEGETDHKIIVLRADDPNFEHINNMADLERVKPGINSKLVDWLKNYKTSDGKPVNKLTSDEPTTPAEAIIIIKEVQEFYRKLVTGVTPAPLGYALPPLH